MRTITTHDAPATTLRGIADTSWHVRGLCRDMPAETADALFFPKPRDHQAIAQAKSLCGRCPVRRDCFNHALDNGIKDGTWGGLTEAERRPWHAKLNERLDYTRVRAVFQGRDIHLTDPERQAVTDHAYACGWNADRLAYTLQVSPEHARDLLRKAANAVFDRDRYWGLYEDDMAGDEQSQDEDEATPSPPMTRPVHTNALTTPLGKVA